MASRVVTSWSASFGTAVDDNAFDMTVAIALNDSVDSFPPEEVRLVSTEVAMQDRVKYL